MPFRGRREQHLTEEQRAIKWTRGPMDGPFRTWTAKDLPNGCTAVLFAEDVYGVRGGHRSIFGYQVFAADGRMVEDSKPPGGWERWVCVKNVHSVATKAGADVAA